jgi:hypothetical protein
MYVIMLFPLSEMKLRVIQTTSAFYAKCVQCGNYNIPVHSVERLRIENLNRATLRVRSMPILINYGLKL